jgi:putative transposase
LGRIVGYAIDYSKSALAVRALNRSVAIRPRRGRELTWCVVHSERGGQFHSKKFLRALERLGLVSSMGRVGAAGDNAAMESFYSLLQMDVFDAQPWRTREELRLRIVKRWTMSSHKYLSATKSVAMRTQSR